VFYASSSLSLKSLPFASFPASSMMVSISCGSSPVCFFSVVSGGVLTAAEASVAGASAAGGSSFGSSAGGGGGVSAAGGGVLGVSPLEKNPMGPAVILQVQSKLMRNKAKNKQT